MLWAFLIRILVWSAPMSSLDPLVADAGVFDRRTYCLSLWTVNDLVIRVNEPWQEICQCCLAGKFLARPSAGP